NYVFRKFCSEDGSPTEECSKFTIEGLYDNTEDIRDCYRNVASITSKYSFTSSIDNELNIVLQVFRDEKQNDSTLVSFMRIKNEGKLDLLLGGQISTEYNYNTQLV